MSSVSSVGAEPVVVPVRDSQSFGQLNFSALSFRTNLLLNGESGLNQQEEQQLTQSFERLEKAAAKNDESQYLPVARSHFGLLQQISERHSNLSEL